MTTHDTQNCISTDYADFQRYHDDYEEYSRAFARLASLKKMKDSSTESLAEVQELQPVVRIASRYHGLAYLPEEIFLQILSLLGRSCKDDLLNRNETVISLSNVSRRFREGVILTPFFWTLWHVPKLARSSVLVRMFSERSTTMGITLDLRNTRKTKDSVSVDEILAFFLRGTPFRECVRRIVDIRVDDFTIGALANTGFQIPTCTFPAVTTVSFTDKESWDLGRYVVWPLSGAWSFPDVQKLSITGTNLLPLIHFRNARHLVLHITDVTPTGTRLGLLQGLSGMKNLQHLDLRDHSGSLGLESMLLAENVTSLGVPLELSSVITFMTMVPYGKNKHLQKLSMRHIRLPSLVDLHVAINSRSTSDIYVSDFFDSDLALAIGRDNSVKSFTLSVDADNSSPEPYPSFPLRKSMAAVSRIEVLTIKYDASVSLNHTQATDIGGSTKLNALRMIKIVPSGERRGVVGTKPSFFLTPLRSMALDDVKVVIVSPSEDDEIDACSIFSNMKREWSSDLSILELNSAADF